MAAMYEFTNTGLCRPTGSPQYGKQDRGVSPGGAMDLFSYQTGNLILGNPADTEVLEIIIPPEIRFTKTCYGVVTGAAYNTIWLSRGDSKLEIPHATVFQAPAGSSLRFGTRRYGFRSYLCCTSVESATINPVGRQLAPFQDIAEWAEPDNTVRILPGPEYRFLDHPQLFSNHPWKVSNDVSNMGMRLTCLREMPSVSLTNMISGAVSDGTIQLTPTGPIILLRHRQTVGGYPRIFNVITADIDTLGQYQPGQIIRFRQVDIGVARRLTHMKEEVLGRLKRQWNR